MLENKGYIQIRISGFEGGHELTPDTYDIKDLREMLENAEGLFYSGSQKRPPVTLQIEKGSVVHKFVTNIQTVVQFGALLMLISQTSSLDGLDAPTATAFENIQKMARARDLSFSFSTSQDNASYNPLVISQNTDLRRSETLWADSEFYFYGSIVNAGGKKDANIHLDVKGIGLINIESGKDYLKNQEKNLLYHECGVRVRGKQNIETGEMDLKNLQLIELVDYSPKFDEDYIDALVRKAYPKMKDVNPDKWMDEIRGRAEYA